MSKLILCEIIDQRIKKIDIWAISEEKFRFRYTTNAWVICHSCPSGRVLISKLTIFIETVDINFTRVPLMFPNILFLHAGCCATSQTSFLFSKD